MVIVNRLRAIQMFRLNTPSELHEFRQSADDLERSTGPVSIFCKLLTDGTREGINRLVGRSDIFHSSFWLPRSAHRVLSKL